jgi:hypothetical protein
MIKADLHIHSNYSDGSDDIKNLAENIKLAGLEIFALSDHDTIAGCEEMEKFFTHGFIPSVELTCITQSIKCHILGYNVNCKNERLLELIEKGKEFRKYKLEVRMKYLKDRWNIILTDTELNWLYSRKSVVKTHLANILVSRGLASDNVSAMKKYLDGCKSGDIRFDAKEAVNTIIDAGGIPVWAHPIGGEGEIHISKDVFLRQLEIMKEIGIKGLECYYSRYSDIESRILADIAEQNGLFISGGSDYHGKNKSIPLAKLSSDNTFIPAEKLTILSQLKNL